ncbi:TIGR03943 family putative permease subunit [Cohnella soli]|uniref:TIGR03943 family putative permease subunit n=1 Tax=Cohnella soli TaxID=425005 RepID=A0ABW0HYW9_9BACL
MHRTMARHYWIRAGILFALSWYIVHLVKTGNLYLYIVPRMMPYVKCGALALFVLAGFYAFLAIQRSDDSPSEPDCECGHETPASVSGNVWLYGLFAIPLVLGFVLPDRLMGSEVVAVKGMNLKAAAASQGQIIRTPEPVDDQPTGQPVKPEPSESFEPSEQPVQPEMSDTPETTPEQPVKQSAEQPIDELDKLFPEDEYGMDYAKLGKRLYPYDTIHVHTVGYLEMLTMLDLYQANFKGKQIVISGFVYREDDMEQDEFVVSRMAMQCCSADATPYGFLVRWDKGASLKKDTWISMTGTLSTTVYRGNKIIRLEANKIKIIPAPKDPYVYPYYDDFDQISAE